MEIKILQVFYDKNGLPYKDKERTVHYPITSGTFLGASNTTQIRFYYDQLDELNESTFVAVSKLPNGKIGSEILESEYDSELQENYAVLNLSSFYTQYKGDVYISLQGYQGGVSVEQDENGIYQIYGTPTIQATGSIKLSIAYAPTFIGSGQTENITLQRVLAELSTKLGIRQETLHVEELPEIGNPNIWYVVNDDPNDTNKANIYIWNATTQTYVWVGDNTLDLGNYYTQEQGEQFESDVDNRVTSVENELSSVASGSPKGVYATLSDLETAYPTGTTGIYVVSANGHWYYWNGSAWTDGGLYLSTQNYTDIENTLDKVLIETETTSLGAGGLVAPLKVKAGQTIRIKITGPGANVWLRETFGGSDLEELGYVNANATKDFVATYDGNYLRFYCEGASTIKCDILETYIPTLFDKVDDIESDVSDLQGDVSDLQSDVTTLNSLKAENLKVKQQYSFNNGIQVFTDFDDAPANTRVYLASGITNYDHAPENLFGAANSSYVETYKIGNNIEQYVWMARVDGSGVLCHRSMYVDNSQQVWSDWDYNDYGNEPIIVSTATELFDAVGWVNSNGKKNAIVKLTPNTTFDFSNGIRGSYNDIPLGLGITIEGSPNSVIYCNYEGDDTDVNQLYSIFKKYQAAGGFTLKGVVIKAYNIRYCVHDEAGNMPDVYHNRYINCDFYLNQDGKTDAQRNYYLQCIGGGLGRCGNILIIGCRFETVFSDFTPSTTNPDISEVSYHNVGGTSSSDNDVSHITIIGNYFKHTCAVSCYGYQTSVSHALISNNDVSVKPYKYWQSGDAANNMDLKEWNNHLHDAPEFTESDYTPYINSTYGSITSNSCYEMGKMLFLNFKILTAASISAWTEIGSMKKAYGNVDYYLNAFDGSGNRVVLYLAPAGSIYCVTPVSAGVTIQVSAQVRVK